MSCVALVHPAEVGLPSVVDEQRHDDDHGVGAGHGVGVVGGGAQLPGRDEAGEVLGEVGLARERRHARRSRCAPSRD